MPLTTAERKHRMPFGSQREIAREEAVDEAYVSKAIADEIFPKTDEARVKLRRVRVAIARRLKVRVDEAFPQPAAAAVA